MSHDRSRPPTLSVATKLDVPTAVAALLGFLLSVPIVNAQDGEAKESGMLPVQPQALFAALPGKMDNWKLTRSVAEGRYSDWLESRVVREFERQLPAKPGEPPPPLSTTRISITDTARNANSISIFEDFTPGEEEGFERKFLDGDPAYIIDAEESELEIEMLVAGRFLVRIVSENQPEDYFEEWLKRLNRKKLRSIPETAVVELPETILISHIDQLDPTKNRAYYLATSSTSRVSAEVEEDDAWLKEVLGEIPEIPEATEIDADSDSPVRVSAQIRVE